MRGSSTPFITFLIRKLKPPNPVTFSKISLETIWYSNYFFITFDVAMAPHLGRPENLIGYFDRVFNEINYNEKTAKKKRRASWFSRYFGQSSRPSSGDLMKIRIVVTL